MPRKASQNAEAGTAGLALPVLRRDLVHLLEKVDLSGLLNE